jgi:hypothetical protein
MKKLSLFIGMSIFLIATCVSAFGADDVSASSSKDLESFRFSDEEIASRCKISIAKNINMVTTDDGRTIPKCVQMYEVSRSVAVNYRASESEEVEKVKKPGHSCDNENTQEHCLAAGSSVALDAIKAHQALHDSASKAEERLTQLAGAGE